MAIRLTDTELVEDFVSYGVVHGCYYHNGYECTDCGAWFGKGKVTTLTAHIICDVFITDDNGSMSAMVDGKMRKGNVYFGVPFRVDVYEENADPEIELALQKGCSNGDFEDAIHIINSVAQISESMFMVMSISKCDVVHHFHRHMSYLWE